MFETEKGENMSTARISFSGGGKGEGSLAWKEGRRRDLSKDQIKTVGCWKSEAVDKKKKISAIVQSRGLTGPGDGREGGKGV